jgi:glycerol-3-phosphate dehydrogenase
LDYDLVVIGGGIIGTGIARDAALRGLRVALFEKDDFGSGTTSRSTRIIHGGLRYLEKLDFDLVYEALHERRYLLKNAPHLVHPLPFLFPSYRKKGHPFLALWAGIGLYDAMNPRRGMPHHQMFAAAHALRLEPSLRKEGLRGGFLYYDAQCQYPERLCVENVIDAAAHGARIENHARVVSLLQTGASVHGVRVHDEETGREEDVEARIVLNVTGPWLDEVEKLATPDAPARLRRTKGVHLVVPRFTQHALIMETADAKRVFFAIPWGAYTLLGTTDTDYVGRNEDVAADDGDVDYLLREIRNVLDVDLKESDILFTTAGLRPLRRQLGRATADISRKHQIVDHEPADGRAGLVTVLGGKITTFRNIAQEVVDFVYEKLGRPAPPSRTIEEPVPGGRAGDWKGLQEELREAARRQHVPEDVTAHWLGVYGARARRLLEIVRQDPALLERLDAGRPYVRAEIVLATEEEFCGGLSDFMLRRSMWGLQAGQGVSSASRVVAELARVLGWDAPRRTREESAYLETVRRMRGKGVKGRAAVADVKPI